MKVGESAGRMRMAPSLGAVDGVHGAKTAGREIGEHQLAAGFQDPEHFVKHALRIIEVMEDVPGQHGVKAGRSPWETAGVADEEADAMRDSGMDRFELGMALFSRADIERCDIGDPAGQGDDETTFAGADIEHAPAQRERSFEDEAYARFRIVAETVVDRVSLFESRMVGLDLVPGQERDR